MKIILTAIFALSVQAAPLEPSTHTVALTLLGEARGEGAAGLYRVACVIQQRQIHRGLSARGVCLQRWQFSCWNGNGPSSKLLKSKAAPDAIALARKLVAGEKLRREVVGFADHYCTLKTFPYWARGRKPVAVFGNHKFYKLKKGKL